MRPRKGLLLKPALNLLDWILKHKSGNSLIIGGPLGWSWQATLDATHHGALTGPANAHRHSDLASIGIDDHHARDHASRHGSGQADAVALAASQVTSGRFGMARMPDGTSGYVLTAQGTGTNPAYAAALSGGLAGFGDGSDGDVTVSGNTTLTRDMFYNNLTVNNGVVLDTGGYRIFAKGTLTNNGTIRRNGNNGSIGGVGSGGAALGQATVGGSGAGGDGGTSSLSGSYRGGGGGSGGGVVIIAAKNIVNNSTISVNGGNGANAVSGVAASVYYPTAGGNTSPSLGGSGGNGGSGYVAGAVGGTVTVAPSGGRSLISGLGFETSGTPARIMGGAGGGGGCFGHANSNAGGGGGGGGGFLCLIYHTATWGTETANAGSGGTHTGAGTDGAPGSPGTVVKLANT